MELYLCFILEFWNLFDRRKTGPFCLCAADVYDHYDNNCYNFLLIMQIIFSWQWVDVVELSMSRRHQHYSCLRGRRKRIHSIASSLSTTRRYLTTLTAGNFQTNFQTNYFVIDISVENYSTSNILNFKILISQCNCNFFVPSRWELMAEPGSRIRLELDMFYLTHFGTPGCTGDNMKIYSDIVC